MGFLESAGIKAAGQVAANAGAETFSFPERDIEVKESKPGEHWTNPLQEQHPEVSRFFIKNFASATPETMGRALAENFEVKHRGGYDFSIRKPGEKKWKVVDPDTWSDMIPFWGGDWSDILGDIFTGIGAVTGTALTAPGVVTSAAGAAGGAATAEALKQGIGSLLGSGVTPGEAARSVGFEAGAGAVGDVGGRLLVDPLVKGGLKGARRGLLGNAEEVASRNAAKMAEYEKALTQLTPPEGMGIKEQVKKGYTTVADAMDEARARNDEKLMKWLMRQEPEPQIPKPELETPSYGLFGALARKGEKAADELALAETRGMKELLELEDDVLRQQAAVLGVETTRKATEKDVRDAIISGADDITKREVNKAVKGVADLTARRKTLKQAEKNQLKNFQTYLDRKGLGTESVQKLVDDINAGDVEAAQRLGIDLNIPHAEVAQKVFRRETYVPKEVTKTEVRKAIFKNLDKTTRGEIRAAIKGLSKAEKESFLVNYGLDTASIESLVDAINGGSVETAKRLGIDIYVPGPKTKAVRGQVGRTMEEIAPDQPFEADYVAQQASKEGRGPAGAERTFKGTQRAPLDPDMYREAVAEAEGLNLSELQSLLRRSGWEGPLAKDRETLVFNLYETKFGKSGTGSPESLTGPEFLQSMYNVESKRKGFDPMETIRKENIAEIRSGLRGGEGQVSRTGREALEPSRLRSAALAARPLVRGAGKLTEGLGAVLEAPSRAVSGAAKKLAPRWIEQFVRTPERQLVTGTAGSLAGGTGGVIAAIGGAGLAGKGLKKLGHAIAADNSGQTLIRLASKAPRDIAEKLMKPLEAKAERGIMAYKAAVFAMFHNPDVRQWISAQEVDSERQEDGQ